MLLIEASPYRSGLSKRGELLTRPSSRIRCSHLVSIPELLVIHERAPENHGDYLRTLGCQQSECEKCLQRSRPCYTFTASTSTDLSLINDWTRRKINTDAVMSARRGGAGDMGLTKADQTTASGSSCISRWLAKLPALIWRPVHHEDAAPLLVTRLRTRAHKVGGSSRDPHIIICSTKSGSQISGLCFSIAVRPLHAPIQR